MNNTMSTNNKTTNLTLTQQHELKTKGMIINQDFENAIQAMEAQNNTIIKDNKKYFVSSTGKHYPMTTMTKYIEENRSTETSVKATTKKATHYRKLTPNEKTADTLNDKIINRVERLPQLPTKIHQKRYKELTKRIETYIEKGDYSKVFDIKAERNNITNSKYYNNALAKAILTIDGELITLSKELQAVYDTSTYSEIQPKVVCNNAVAKILSDNELKRLTKAIEMQTFDDDFTYDDKKGITSRKNKRQVEYFYTDKMQIPEYKASLIIALSALKMLARGRKFINKNGETKYTPSNEMACKLLRGENGIISIEDIIQETYIIALQYIQSSDIWIEAGNNNIPIFKGNSGCISDIYNTAQNVLYQQNDKHSKKLHIVSYDENGAEVYNEYTEAMRAYNLNFINQVETCGILEKLDNYLTDIEKAVLKCKLKMKQVERTNKHCGKIEYRKKVYIEKEMTLDEIATECNITIDKVREALKRIKRKAEKNLNNYKLSENENNMLKTLWLKNEKEYKINLKFMEDMKVGNYILPSQR